MKTHIRALLLVSLYSCFLMGCDGRRSGRHLFEQYMADGIPVAVNTGGPKYQGDLFRYEQVVQLVQDPESPESLLYPGATRRWDEQGFLMDENGWFYVQDRGNDRIAAFDPAGRYVHSIGRGGRGPGEFSFLHLTGLSDGILEVYDGALNRITFYRTDGALVGTLACPVGGERLYFNRADSTFTARYFPSERVEEITMLAAGFRTFGRNGEMVGQASTPLIEMYFPYYWIGHKGGEGGQDFPFTSYPAMAWAPGLGVYLTNGLNPVIWLYSADGALLKKITLDISDQPVTRGDRQRFTLDLERQIEESEGDDHDVLQAIRQTLTFTVSKSHWRAVTVDDHGYVWLEVPEWERDLEGRGSGCLYYLLSPEGEFLGSTRAPAAGKIMKGHLLGVLSDPDTGREDYIVWHLIPQADGFSYP